MLPMKIHGANAVFATVKPNGRETRLPVIQQGSVSCSAWELSPDELERLKNGAAVYLALGSTEHNHPPVGLSVGPPAADNPPPLAPETCPLCRAHPERHDSTTRDVMGFALAALTIVQKGGKATFMVKTAIDDLRRELGE